MMESTSAMAREFRWRIEADTAFAKSPSQRMDFFYCRSPSGRPGGSDAPRRPGATPPAEEAPER